MFTHQQHSKPTTKVHSTFFTPFKTTNMKFFAVFALFVLGFALVFGQSVSPSSSPAPSRSASPSPSPAPPLPSEKPVENVKANFDPETPKVTLKTDCTPPP